MARVEVEITHPDKVLFPADGITKGQLVDYYAEVAPAMLPHVKGRPLMLQRYPRGIEEQGFVQKDFAGVRETARALAGVLDELGLTSYLQTTGSRGLHVVVPLDGHVDFDAARSFARDVADIVAADDEAHRTVEARKDKRGDRVYLDVMRNAYAQTAVAPYAVRARAGAPVATPLSWDELGN